MTWLCWGGLGAIAAAFQLASLCPQCFLLLCKAPGSPQGLRICIYTKAAQAHSRLQGDVLARMNHESPATLSHITSHAAQAGRHTDGMGWGCQVLTS